MKLQFEANQQYQLDAINAAVDLFKGQPAGASGFSSSKATGIGERQQSKIRQEAF
jgi:type III restriction enzyme